MSACRRESIITLLAAMRTADRDDDGTRWTSALSILALTVSDRDCRAIKSAALDRVASYDRAGERLVV
jgi:hypothetical protein